MKLPFKISRIRKCANDYCDREAQYKIPLSRIWFCEFHYKMAARAYLQERKKIELEEQEQDSDKLI